MTLRQARCRFTSMLPLLIDKAIELGFLVAIDEATNNQNKGHMPGSLHYLGLAVDLMLYDGSGNYLTDTEKYRPIGEYWKTLDAQNHWGGTFPNPDGDHFSYAPPELVGDRA